MAKKPVINTKSLKEQLYDYLREQIQQLNLKPGASIRMDLFAKKLGVSKTPLRDALIQLEMEDFVTIAPRRGIYVNALTLEDVRNYYQVIGALESSALIVSYPQLTEKDIKRMGELNGQMQRAIQQGNFNLFYEKNLQFHNIFIARCGNRTLSKIIHNLKKRLYDFPRQKKWIKQWEESSILEHGRLVQLLEQGKITEAVTYIRDVHWSFSVQEKFIRQYYPQVTPEE